MEMETAVGAILGRLGRHCYAVLCLGVLLLTVAVVHYVGDGEPTDPRERSKRRLRTLHGGRDPPPVFNRGVSKQYSNHFYLHISASFFLLPLFFISLTCAKITLIDLIFRVDSVCQRYEKYDVQKQRELNAYGDGVFSRLFAAVELEIHAALQKSEVASTEKIRAAAVAMNAEVRRKKARLMDEVPKLCKLARKKVKGVPKEELEVGDDLVLALQERIKAIPGFTHFRWKL
ncbi:syntaxin-71-like [Cucurbita pepo subsp. pepo]|uniref:syntaxin-71-like n=1 Tax=Cucurbita pepo subsp. pepo TaxID=3664 RepID=UPI000C9D5F46|nr:syntaxin-71-like [Cucurbita pepo subsp. pepo]